MKPDWTIVIVVKIVFTRPEKFDRNADLLGDRRGFEHVVVGEASSESPAGAAKMNGNVAGGNFQNVGYLLPTSFGRLAWRPELKLAVRKMRDTILRFERRMRCFAVRSRLRSTPREVFFAPIVLATSCPPQLRFRREGPAIPTFLPLQMPGAHQAAT